MRRKHCGPKVLPATVGYRKPTVDGACRSIASVRRASSPRPEQGGRVETLMQRSWLSTSCASLLQPQSGFDGRRLASTSGLANPTTPASAGRDPRLSSGPLPVPSARHPADASAVAAVSHMPAASIRLSARRVWSAYAADPGRSEFPLEPPSLAPRRKPLPGASMLLNDSLVASRPSLHSGTLSGPRRAL
jgi:hypothetical protein